MNHLLFCCFSRRANEYENEDKKPWVKFAMKRHSFLFNLETWWFGKVKRVWRDWLVIVTWYDFLFLIYELLALRFEEVELWSGGKLEHECKLDIKAIQTEAFKKMFAENKLDEI